MPSPSAAGLPRSARTMLGLALASALILCLIFFPARPYLKISFSRFHARNFFKTKLIGDTVFLDDGNVIVVPRKSAKTEATSPKAPIGSLKRADAIVSAPNPETVKVGPDGVEHHVFALPDDERNAQIAELHHRHLPLNGYGALSRRILSLDLQKDVHYFADYDVAAVNQDIHADGVDQRANKGTASVVSYIDVTSPESKWVGRWVSQKPSVVWIPEFLTDEECDGLIASAKKKLVRSQVALYKGASAKSPVDDARTSEQAWLDGSDHNAGAVIERVMELFKSFPSSAHEPLQVLRYDIGQHYDAHNDYFDPALYGKQANNRAVTVYLYLSDVEEGGETQFPRADGKPPTADFKSCTRGLRFRPMRRAIVAFYDMLPDFSLDATSLHGGCPVKRGIKWGGTLWLRVPTS